MPLQDQLSALFLLDQQLRGLRSRLDAAISRHTAQGNKLERLRQQHTELSEQSKLAESHARSLEKDADAMDQRIDHHREQMNAVTTNREYSALLVEVNTLKVDKSKIEEQALEAMGKLEQLQAQIKELQEQIDQQEKLVTTASEEVQAAKSEVGERLNEVTVERNEAASHVPDDVLLIFERLADAHDGEAMAPIEEQDRRRNEFNCGGCFLSLPVERVNALMTRPDELVTCPNCNRILYMDKQLKAEISVK